MPAVGRAQEVGGESMALGRVAVAQLHNMGDGEEADEVHQHLETMTCGRIIIFFFLNLQWRNVLNDIIAHMSSVPPNL